MRLSPELDQIQLVLFRSVVLMALALDTALVLQLDPMSNNA